MNQFEMKNILVLSTMYPTPYSDFHTPVVHYFTTEWVKMGYNVKVIHYQSKFPIFYYWIASIFTRRVARFIGNDYVETKQRTKEIHFIKDNVQVSSIPLFKLIPHRGYSKKTISKQINNIIIDNNSQNFIPDAIIGHFHNPQIEIVSKLKDIYTEARSCIVLHESTNSIKETYYRNYKKLMNNIDVWGFRYKSLKEEFENNYFDYKKTFICHSGIPDSYINPPIRNFKDKVTKFCFVGQLIKLKRVEDILYSLKIAFPLNDFEFNIIGEGMERGELERISKFLEIDSVVKFWGKLNRDEVQNIMKESDCYVMVSESEAFGLVYLEAMGKGCITIGTKGQGIDGIINDEVNGFLCESSNSNELADIIRQINSFSPEKLTEISINAIETIKELTNKKVANKYIKTVLNI
jgi:L-malate glycosyltransferase